MTMSGTLQTSGCLSPGLSSRCSTALSPFQEARARELFYDNTLWISDATKKDSLVRFHGRNFALITAPRRFWILLTKSVYIDTLSGLLQPALWDGRRCIATPVDPRTTLPRSSVRLSPPASPTQQ